MIPKRTAFRRFLFQSPPKANCFIAEFRLNASTTIAHHAALAPNLPDGNRPPARSSFRTPCTSSPFPHLCLTIQFMPLVIIDLCHRPSELRGHVHTYSELNHPEPLSITRNIRPEN